MKSLLCFQICVLLQLKIIVPMCTYPISLDENLVMQAESTLQINVSFQTWLQQQVEEWLMAQVIGKSQHRSRHSRLTDEELAEKLKAYPMLEEDSFPSLAAEDYGVYLKSRRGHLPKNLEKWL